MTDKPSHAPNRAPSTVRIATILEEDDIWRMCQELHKENGIFSLSENKIRSYLRKCWNREGGMIAVIGPPGHLEAMLYLIISDYYYSDDFHISELWSFVRPDYRKSQHAKALIEWAKLASDEIGMPLLIGVLSNERLEAKVRLYRRQLDDPAGAYFLYKPKTYRPPSPTATVAVN